MNEHLPEYESNATPKQIQEKIIWMGKQYLLIREQQKENIPSEHIKIRCGCNKLVKWIYMYRCLYCGIWYCQECAEQHFGKRRASIYTEIDD